MILIENSEEDCVTNCVPNTIPVICKLLGIAIVYL